MRLDAASSAIVSVIARNGNDYDPDDNNLINVMTTSQLAAIRYDLDGDGVPDERAYATTYSAAFPFSDEFGMCPGICKGYELSNDVDLSSVSDWTPIGGGGTSDRYNAVFEGNGHVVRNMKFARTVGSPPGYDGVGLFGALGANGRIRSVGMENVSVNAPESVGVGALVGIAYGRIAASYAVGGVVTSSWAVGGLVGEMRGGTVIAGYSNVPVHGRGQRAGGLIGSAQGVSIVSASYTIGVPTGGGGHRGGLMGFRLSTVEIQSSYFDRERTGQTRCCGTNPPSSDNTSKTSAELRIPTEATGIYAGWDRLDVAGDGDFNDAPWDFGSSLDYPLLRGMSARYPTGNTASAAVQRRLQPPILATLSQRGGFLATEDSTATYAVELDFPSVGAVTMNWSVELTGASTGHAAAPDFSGATSGEVVLVNTDSVVFQVEIARDDVLERLERFRVRLSDLRGADNFRLSGAASAVVSVIAPQGRDYDENDDGLIEVATTSQLAAITHDLRGGGLAGVDYEDVVAYEAAYPFFDVGKTCARGCKGYELLNDLNLSGLAWQPIGSGLRDARRPATGNRLPEEYLYKGVFEGNGHVISNMIVVGTASPWQFVGLFQGLGAGGVIRNVGLEDVNVALHPSSIQTGGLAGVNYGGKVAACWVKGRVVGGWGVGGLVAGNEGTIIASYTDVDLYVGASPGGGLVGHNAPGGKIIASYSLWRVQLAPVFITNTNRRYGGLVGINDGAIESSYFDRQRSGLSSGGLRVSSSAVQTSRALRSPIAAEGIYADWDGLDLDGDGDFNDAPWDFGGPFQYPVLGQARTEAAVQAQYSRQPTVTLTPTFAGDATVSEGTSASYEVSLGWALPLGITASWSWSVGSSDAGVGAGDFGDASVGRVDIEPGRSSASFSLEVAEDREPEFAEVFEVSLSDARLAGALGNVNLVNPSSGVRTTIAVNELGQVTVEASSAMVAEGATATFTLRLNGGIGDVSVDFGIVPASEGVTPADLERMVWSDHAGTESKLVSSFENSTGAVALTRMNNVATVLVGVAADDVPGESGERFRVELTGCRGCAAAFVEIGVPSSAQATISRTPLAVSAWVYLQGAYAGSSRMNTNLTGVLPQRQPYVAAPWHYRTTTTVPHVPEVGLGGVAQPIVDWVLVELRASTSGAGAGAAVPVVDGFAAGLLLADGRIAGIDEGATTAGAALSLAGVPVAAGFAPGSEIYVLIHHRNHLSVMSAHPVAYGGAGCEGGYCVDFRRRRSYDGCAHLRHADGNRLMAAGDTNRSGVVSWGDDDFILNNPRRTLRAPAAYAPGRVNYYVDGDLDFDGRVSLADARVIADNNLLSSRECAPHP